MSPSPGRNGGVTETNPLTEQNFDKALVATSSLVMIDFSAEWYSPCRAIAPVLEELAETSKDRITLMTINVDENPALTARYGIRSIPTIVFFKESAIVDRIVS